MRKSVHSVMEREKLCARYARAKWGLLTCRGIWVGIPVVRNAMETMKKGAPTVTVMATYRLRRNERRETIQMRGDDDCPKCGGTGKGDFCHLCSGTGTIGKGDKSGYTGPPIDCPQCDNGYEACDACGGSGKAE